MLLRELRRVLAILLKVSNGATDEGKEMNLMLTCCDSGGQLRWRYHQGGWQERGYGAEG